MIIDNGNNIIGKWWEELKKSIAYPISQQKDTFELIHGFFVASELDWENVKTKMKNYTVTRGINNTIKKFERGFPPYEICKAIIELHIKSMSKKEIKTYIPHYIEKKKALADAGKNIIAWLERKTGENTFHNFVEFTINLFLDIKKFESLNANRPDSEKVTAIESIIDVSEWTAEQVVYSDFYKAFNETQDIDTTSAKTEMIETTKDETKKGETNTFEVKEKVRVRVKQKVSPFAYYRPKNNINPIITPPKEFPGCFRLGKKLTLEATLNESTDDTPPSPKLNLTLKEFTNSSGNGTAAGITTQTARYKLILESEYFTCEPKISQLEQNKPSKVELKPIIDKLTAEEKNDSGYSVKFKLVDTKYNVTYPEKERNIKLTDPDLKINLVRPNWPHKGWPIELTFNITEARIDLEIPLTLKGKIGPDFFVVNPPPSDETKKGEINHKFKVKSKGTKPAHFTLKAQRAGVWPWFRNEAYFEFSVGKWKFPIKQKEFSVYKWRFGKLKSGYHWKMRMNVFPSWFDTFISGFAGIYILLTLYYPETFPPITAALNISTLTLPPSIIYLAYRIINWGRTLQSKPT